MTIPDRWHKRFILYLLVITAIHGLYAAFLGLGDDEAYYWEWGQHPALSYFDHPPMVAWAGRVGCLIFGNTAFGFRFPAVLFSALFLLVLYRHVTGLTGDTRTAFRTAFLIGAVPLFAAGAFMMVPDAMLGLFWVLALELFRRSVIEKSADAWYLLGAVFGLGLLSKYNMILLPVCAATFLLLSREDRHWLKRKEPYLALLIGMALFLPVIVWNWQRGFPSFAYHLVERNASHGWSWRPMQLFFAGQLGYLSPLVFAAAWIAMGWAGFRGVKYQDRTWLLLASFSAPYVLFFSIICCITPTTKPHWPAFGYVAAMVAAVILYERIRDHATSARRRWAGIGAWIAVGLSLCMTLCIHVQAVYPVIRLKPKQDVTNELHGWPQAARAIEAEVDRLKQAGKPVFIAAPRYNIASPIAFYTREHFPAYSITPRHDQFDQWGRGSLAGRVGANGLWVADNRYKVDPSYAMHCDSIVKAAPVVVYRAGRPVREFYLYRCYGYRGPAAPDTIAPTPR